jgi:hypothetical protein
MDQFDTKDTNYFHIIKNNISPLDLYIINKLNEGYSLDEIADIIEKEFDIQQAKKTVKSRFKKLLSEEKPEDSIILFPTPKYILNPSKLFGSISLILIKANLDTIEQKNTEIGIQNVFDTILDINNKPQFEKPIKQLFTTSGWNYDFFGLVYINNTKRFHEFRNYLINEGIVKTVDIVPVNVDDGFLFNPIASPDTKNFKHFLIHYQNRMKNMMDEFHKKEVKSAETMRFFDKYDFGLKVLAGKSKGEFYPIDGPELKIGRYYDNDIIIKDIVVSRRHAKITMIGNKFIFKDQSTNGSYINDKLLVYDEMELHEGDTISIGKSKFQFQKITVG